MTIKEFILQALEHDPMTERTAQMILKRILMILGYCTPKNLPEHNETVR